MPPFDLSPCPCPRLQGGPSRYGLHPHKVRKLGATKKRLVLVVVSCCSRAGRGGRFVTSGVELLRRLTFSSFRTTKCLRCCFLLGLGASLGMLKRSTVQSACAFYQKWPTSVGIYNGHWRIHSGTPRNTTLHHPSTGSLTNDIDPKHNIITSIPYTSGSVSQLFVSSFAYLWRRPVDSLLVNKEEWVVGALGRRWTWRLWRATCRRASRRVPSPRTGGQAAVFPNVLRPTTRRSSSTLCRWHAIASDTRALERDPREMCGLQ